MKLNIPIIGLVTKIFLFFSLTFNYQPVVSDSIKKSYLGTGKNTENSKYANARRLHFNGNLLPDTSFYVPNSYPNSRTDKFYGFLHGISRVRTRSAKSGCEPRCSDAIAYFEVDLWKKKKQSLSSGLAGIS